MADRKAFPWMPSYVDEFFSLAATLTNEELGAMMRLRHHAWRQEPPCTLPDDDRKLATLSGLGARWGELGDAIRELFTPVDGRLLDAGLMLRYEQQLKKHVAHSLAGAKGGRPRKSETKPTGKQPVKLGETLASLPVSALSVLSSSSDGRSESLEQEKRQGSPAFRADPHQSREWIDVRERLKPRASSPDREVATASPAPTSLDAGASHVPPPAETPSPDATASVSEPADR